MTAKKKKVMGRASQWLGDKPRVHYRGVTRESDKAQGVRCANPVEADRREVVSVIFCYSNDHSVLMPCHALPAFRQLVICSDAVLTLQLTESAGADPVDTEGCRGCKRQSRVTMRTKECGF